MDNVVYFSRKGKYRSLSHIRKSKISKQYSINKDNNYILSLQYHGKKHSVIDFYLSKEDVSKIFIHGISKAYSTGKEYHYSVHNIVPRDKRVYYKLLDELSDSVIFKLLKKRQLDLKLNVEISSKTYKYAKALHSRVIIAFSISYRGGLLRYKPYNIQPYEIIISDDQIATNLNNIRKLI